MDNEVCKQDEVETESGTLLDKLFSEGAEDKVLYVQFSAEVLKAPVPVFTIADFVKKD